MYDYFTVLRGVTNPLWDDNFGHHQIRPPRPSAHRVKNCCALYKPGSLGRLSKSPIFPYPDVFFDNHFLPYLSIYLPCRTGEL
jgi:hypothetical protein